MKYTIPRSNKACYAQETFKIMAYPELGLGIFHSILFNLFKMLRYSY